MKEYEKDMSKLRDSVIRVMESRGYIHGHTGSDTSPKMLEGKLDLPTDTFFRQYDSGIQQIVRLRRLVSKNGVFFEISLSWGHLEIGQLWHEFGIQDSPFVPIYPVDGIWINLEKSEFLGKGGVVGKKLAEDFCAKVSRFADGLDVSELFELIQKFGPKDPLRLAAAVIGQDKGAIIAEANYILNLYEQKEKTFFAASEAKPEDAGLRQAVCSIHKIVVFAKAMRSRVVD